MNPTPGQWVAERVHAINDYQASWAITGMTDAGNDTRTIALVGGPHAEADARLIAAVPELLEALHDCLDQMGLTEVCVNCSSYEGVITPCRAHAAITKATA